MPAASVYVVKLPPPAPRHGGFLVAHRAGNDLSMLRDAAKRTLTAGGQGSVGEKAAAALTDFVVLDMVASVCTGRASPKDAIAVAERQAKRIYR